MTDLEAISASLARLGKVVVQDVTVEDGTDSRPTRKVGEQIPELVYGPKVLEYTITVMVYPND